MSIRLILVRPMKPVVTLLLLLLGTAVHADPDREKNVINDVQIEVSFVIVDVSYDANTSSGKTDSERIMKSVQLK